MTGPGQPVLASSRLPVAPLVNVTNAETFWQAFEIYLSFAEKIVNAGGFGYGDIINLGNNSYFFNGSFAMPGLTPAQTSTFIAPLFASFAAAGVKISIPMAGTVPYAIPGNGTGVSPSARIFSSRLLPRALWANATLLSQTAAAIRRTVEAGYSVRTRAYGPSRDVAGYPGNETAAVNPAMRDMVIHATVFEPTSVAGLSAARFRELHSRLNSYVEELRRLTPGSGAYYNEADRLEPDWQKSFFGENYSRLLAIKKAVDPWGLFWAPATVGSEAWDVVTADGLPTQNGPLCRTGS
jgi:hypothetical protein